MTAIRPFRDEDAPVLAEIFFESVRKAGLRHYSRRQTIAWAPWPPKPESYMARSRDGRLLLVAENAAGAVVAYGDLQPDGHIDHLFCHPEAVGTGMADAIVERLEAAAIHRGLPVIHVHASEAAKGLFLRRGFALVKRREFAVQGVAIHNYRLEKTLLP